MIEVIQKETKKIIFNCCSRYAKGKNISVDDVQLILGLNEDGNTYTICENYVVKQELDIMQVLGVKIDFLGYSNIAPPFILKSIIRYSEEYKIPILDTKIMCLPYVNERGKNDLSLFLYKNYTEYVTEIEFSDLFRQEDMEMPNM
jgi:hypothetical protein